MTLGSSYGKKRSKSKPFGNHLSDEMSVKMIDTMKEQNRLAGEYFNVKTIKALM